MPVLASTMVAYTASESGDRIAMGTMLGLGVGLGLGLLVAEGVVDMEPVGEVVVVAEFEEVVVAVTDAVDVLEVGDRKLASWKDTTGALTMGNPEMVKVLVDGGHASTPDVTHTSATEVIPVVPLAASAKMGHARPAE